MDSASKLSLQKDNGYIYKFLVLVEIQSSLYNKKVQEFLMVNNKLDLSIKGINDALLRVGDTCRSEYTSIQDRIRKSKWVHIDETGFHVDGEKYWLWAFRSAESDVLVVITDSRGRDVVRGTMGEDFHGHVIVDGWKAYSYLTIIQRCWANPIREVDAFKSSETGAKISDEIHSMFSDLKEDGRSCKTP